MRLSPDARFDRYEILEFLGASPAGTAIYRAYDPKLGCAVELKVLPGMTDANLLRNFKREARATGAVNHPNVLTIYEIGICQDMPYVASELLEGETLDQRLRAGPLTTSQATAYAFQAAQGLAALHDKGIVHLGLKPANLFITRDGRVKIVWFTLARLSAPTADGAGHSPEPETEQEHLMGTIGYLSPEQLQGDRMGDARSDLFGLGAIFYEMLAGRRAFGRASVNETLRATIQEEPPEMSARIPVALDPVVRQCLKKNPSERLQSAQELVLALAASSAGEPENREHMRFTIHCAGKKLYEYNACDQATRACKRIINEFLLDANTSRRFSTDHRALFRAFLSQNNTPKLESPDLTCSFFAEEYARQRCLDLAGVSWADPCDDDSASYDDDSDTYTKTEDSSLTAVEIMQCLRNLREPATVGGVTETGGLDCFLRLPDGTAMRFRRAAGEANVELSVAAFHEHSHPIYPQRPYGTAERCWKRGSRLLLTGPQPLASALASIRYLAQSGNTALDLSFHGLTELPPELWSLLPNLTKLNLRGNFLTSLSSDIGRLASLEQLDLELNLLTSLPPELGQLRSLRSLNVGNNLLSSLPDEICGLTNLTALLCSSNRLSTVPAQIWRLSNLESLYLGYNRLRAVPPQMGQLVRLKRLRLQDNWLQMVPAELGRLKLKDWDEMPNPHLPSPDDGGFMAGGNPFFEGERPHVAGSALRNTLAKKLKSRLAARDWYDLFSQPTTFDIQSPGLMTPLGTLHFQANFKDCRYSAMERSRDPLECPLADESQPLFATPPLTRKTLDPGPQLPGIEAAIEEVFINGPKVLRKRVYVSRSHRYELEVEGNPEHAFAAESCEFLHSLRLWEWEYCEFECRIRCDAADESHVLRNLRQAFPEMLWNGGDSSWDKIRVSGKGPDSRVWVYRYEDPLPFDLTLGLRSPDPERASLALRNRVLAALDATLC